MTFAELIAAFRQRVDDLEGKKLWSDNEAKSLINEAYYEAVERSQGISDESRVSLRAGKSVYTVANALRIEWVLINGESLLLFYRDSAGNEGATWRDDAIRRPTRALVRENEMRVWPIPDQAYSALVGYRRLPLSPLINDTDTPELAARFHLRLLDWAFHLAYDKRDADAEDKMLAEKYAARFTESFGPRLTLAQQSARSDTRLHTTKSSW